MPDKKVKRDFQSELFGMLDDFRRRLAKVQAGAVKPEARPGGSERLLLEENYFSLILFGLFNPVIKTMRGLCFASHLKRVQDEVCGRPVSLGSFSEAQGVFDPELLRQVFLDLSGEISTSWGDERLAHLADKLVDGSLLPALPRMTAYAKALWQAVVTSDETTPGTALIALCRGYTRDQRDEKLAAVWQQALALAKDSSTPLAVKVTALAIAGESGGKEVKECKGIGVRPAKEPGTASDLEKSRGAGGGKMRVF